MKVTAPISVQALRAMKPGDELADGACPGLRARAREKGVVWSLVATDFDGVKKRVEIGGWPETGVPQARLLAAEYKAAIKREKQVDMRLTLSDVIALYEKEGPALQNKSWETSRKRLEYVFAALLAEPSSALTSADFQRVADKHASKISAGAAVRYLRPVLNWAAKRAYAPKGVAAELEEPGRAKRRERFLSEEELMRILPKLGITGSDGAARMMLLTIARREEVCTMRFEDIIEDVWFVPGIKRKNGLSHVIPLSQAAQRVIGAQGRTSGLVFLSPTGKALNNWNLWQKVIYEKTGTSDWHRHDLRRTGATILGDQGVSPHIIEICLGHSVLMNDAVSKSQGFDGRLAAVYNRSRYAKEHAEAMDILADVLQGIEIRGRGSA